MGVQTKLTSLQPAEIRSSTVPEDPDVRGTVRAELRGEGLGPLTVVVDERRQFAHARLGGSEFVDMLGVNTADAAQPYGRHAKSVCHGSCFSP